jgi:phosphate/sulfate permease
VGEILLAWLLTIPATAVVAAGLYWFATQAAPAIIRLFP